MKQTHVLFVCTGNAGRSQMAEALFRQRVGDEIKVSSAGVAPWDDLHPVAVRLLNERGIDLRGRRPCHVASWLDQAFDFVVTLGNPALNQTPELRGNPRRIHWAIPDPADADASGPAAQTAAFQSALAAIENRLPDLKSLACSVSQARALNLTPGISTLCTILNFEQPVFDPVRHLPWMATAGFQSFELECYFGSTHFPWDIPERLADLVKIAADSGLSINSVHAPGNGIFLADPRQRRLMVDLTRSMADAATVLGARVVVIHGGLPTGLDPGAGEAVLQETLSELEHHILPMPCVFGWENEAPGLTAEQHVQWIRKFNAGAFGLVLDVGHAHIQGDLDAYLKGAGLRLVGIHLHDNQGREDSHLIPGQGTIAWPECIRGIVKTGYVGPLMMEPYHFKRAENLPVFLSDIKQAADRLREIAVSVK